jgi:putative transposase
MLTKAVPALRQQPGTVTNTDDLDPVQVKRAYKFRAYPTRPQEARAVRLLRDHCDLYNAALAERREAWRMAKVSIGYHEQSAQLRAIRADDPEGQGRHSFTAQQQTLRRLHAAFGAFFRRVRAGQPAGYPRFKPYQRFDQVLFVAGDGAKWEPADGRARGDRWAHARFQAVGRVKVNQHRAVQGRIKTVQLKRESRRWYVIVVAGQTVEPLPATGRAVGVDLGLARFLTTSDGQLVANPRFLAEAQARIADLQQRKARTKRGSGNRRRLRRRLAREWRRVRNQRRDFHHKTARALVDACDALALEDLRIANMTQSAKGSVDAPGRNVAQKAGLNRLILDAGWGQFTSLLTAKAASAGRRVVLVNPAYTSIGCHACGARCTRPSQAVVVCPTCGEHDADLNGARNIATRAGLGSGQALVA